jgi:glycosyltransferase involved in cell wall biosynthesis
VNSRESIPIANQLNHARYLKARNLHLFDVDSPYYLLWQFDLVDWLNSWNPDVLIVEANPRYLSTRRAIAWMHARRRPVLGWGLGVQTLGSSSSPGVNLLDRVIRRTRRKFLQSLDGLIAYSRRGAREYELEGIAGERIFVAKNAVAPKPEGEIPNRPLKISEHSTVIFVGRLQARKRIDNLLLACSKLPEHIQPRLWIIGDGPERAKLQELAASIYPAAEFCGTMRGAELESTFIKSDLFVLPGTGGLALQEAMSYGLPVIAAEGDGTQEDLVREGNGWLVAPGDILALGDALHEALSDTDRLRKMGEESFRIVKEEINIQEMTRTFIQALNSIVPG